jgi:hypothetical protein
MNELLFGLSRAGLAGKPHRAQLMHTLDGGALRRPVFGHRLRRIRLLLFTALEEGDAFGLGRLVGERIWHAWITDETEKSSLGDLGWNPLLPMALYQVAGHQIWLAVSGLMMPALPRRE